jgi:hypothetical protein
MLETLVTPRTLPGWYRKLVAKKYDGTARRGPGGRRKPADVVELVLRMARENSGWGYTRIRGALFNIGRGARSCARIGAPSLPWTSSPWKR